MDLSGKKVALLGFGLENRSILPYLQERGAIITICDKNAALSRDLSGIAYRLGPDYLKDLMDFDLIFRSPGLPFLTPEIQAAKTAGVLVTSQTKLFFEECPAKIIGVTGTKGKGTTAALIYEILKSAQRRQELTGQAYLVGNIGTPAVTILGKARKEDWVIFELSSFQLQDLAKSPQVAVVLAVSQDHLDHHKSLAEYTESKKNIVRFQTASDLAVLNRDSEITKSFTELTAAQVHYFSKEDIVGPERQALARYHLENAAAALTVARLLKLSQKAVSDGLANFKGLPHRLEWVATLADVDYYDDSFATTPEAAIAAVESFRQPVTLIAGGSSKGADFGNLKKAIARSTVKNIICVGQEGDLLYSLWQDLGINILRGGRTMAEIVAQAKNLAKPGEVVLLSPACASFDMFKNASDRGDQFKAVLQAHKK